MISSSLVKIVLFWQNCLFHEDLLQLKTLNITIKLKSDMLKAFSLRTTYKYAYTRNIQNRPYLKRRICNFRLLYLTWRGCPCVTLHNFDYCDFAAIFETVHSFGEQLPLLEIGNWHNLIKMDQPEWTKTQIKIF